MKHRKIYYSYHLEKLIGEFLQDKNIPFTHESENEQQRLDFYLKNTDVYIEVKQYHSDRISNQLKLKDNIIVLQGKKSVDLFLELIDLKLSDNVALSENG